MENVIIKNLLLEVKLLKQQLYGTDYVDPYPEKTGAYYASVLTPDPPHPGEGEWDLDREEEFLASLPIPQYDWEADLDNLPYFY